MSAFGASHRRQILNCPLKHIDVNNNLPFLYSKTVHTYFEVRGKPFVMQCVPPPQKKLPFEINAARSNVNALIS